MSYSSDSSIDYIVYDGNDTIRLIKWKIGKGTRLSKGTILFLYSFQQKEFKFKSNCSGTVADILVPENSLVVKGEQIVKYERCTHPTIMKDLCAECGQDLRQLGNHFFIFSFNLIKHSCHLFSSSKKGLVSAISN